MIYILYKVLYVHNLIDSNCAHIINNDIHVFMENESRPKMCGVPLISDNQPIISLSSYLGGLSTQYTS